MLERANKIIVNNLEKITPVPIPIINDNKATKLISITYILPILPLSSPINVKIPISFFRCAKKNICSIPDKEKDKDNKYNRNNFNNSCNIITISIF